MATYNFKGEQISNNDRENSLFFTDGTNYFRKIGGEWVQISELRFKNIIGFLRGGM